MLATRRSGSANLSDLYTPLLALVCAQCEAFVMCTALRLLGTCRMLYALSSDDSFFRLVAVLKWGSRFWADALTRPTRRVFRSMRDELASIDRFQALLAQKGFPAWKEVDFRRFWAWEAAACNSGAAETPSSS